MTAARTFAYAICTAALITASAAHAQDAAAPLQTAPDAPHAIPEQPAPEHPTAANGENILFDAAEVTRATPDSPIVATGGVTAYFGNRRLMADTVTYDPEKNLVTASGNVSITDETTGQVAFAESVELTGDLADGVATTFSAYLGDNARVAADTAIRRRGAVNQLHRAVYSGCNVRTVEGDAKTPTWRIRAMRVTQDSERKVVRFTNAFFEVKGVPILYTPFLQIPDPSVERQSGFLTPTVGTSQILGLYAEVPYYFALSNSQDLTLFPQFHTQDSTLWQGEWRKRTHGGQYKVDAGVINFDDAADPTVDLPGVRWYYFGKGQQTLTEKWSASFDIERVSDDTFLRRYNVRQPGELSDNIDTAYTNRLRSNLNLTRRTPSSLLTIDSYLFQGLRASDDSSLTPIVAPMVNYEKELATPVIGGRTSLTGNLLVLQRTSGADTRRISTSVAWRRSITTKSGHVFNFFAETRADAYLIEDAEEGTEFGPVQNVDSNITGRILPTVGLDWSYPLARRFRGATLIVTPEVQLAASTSGGNSKDIINEDSQNVEFDTLNLFRYNKSTGLDLVEDGQRANMGMRATAYWDNGFRLEAAVGEQFRIQATNAFDQTSGLGQRQSDIVGSIEADFGKHFQLTHGFRLDDNGFAIRRSETTASSTVGPVAAEVSYIRLADSEPLIGVFSRSELNANARLALTRHWSTAASWRQDIETGQSIRQTYSIAYSDECALFELTYQRDFTRDVGLPPDRSIQFRFTLRSLTN